MTNLQKIVEDVLIEMKDLEDKKMLTMKLMDIIQQRQLILIILQYKKLADIEHIVSNLLNLQLFPH